MTMRTFKELLLSMIFAKNIIEQELFKLLAYRPDVMVMGWD
jgi:hypothetical protein